jgi:hypothetical protein
MKNLHCLRPNGQEVAAKIIDDEAILINVASGVYYSMDKTGALIWSLVEAQCAVAGIVDVLTRRYDVPRPTAEADVERLAGELLEENLAFACEQAVPLDDSWLAVADSKLRYEPPQLNAYRDMGNLLALDPPMPGVQPAVWEAPSTAAGSKGD